MCQRLVSFNVLNIFFNLGFWHKKGQVHITNLSKSVTIDLFN